MYRWTTLGMLALLFLVWGCRVSTPSDLVVAELRCEYLENPLGIDTLDPRLSWKLFSDTRGQKQTAYRILVASSLELLDSEKGDLWDTNRVASDATSQIVYSGKPLVSRTRCFWKVLVWDREDRLVKNSPSAFWTMGLLAPNDWQAKWISSSEKPPPVQTDPYVPGPPPPWFRTSFDLEKPIKRAYAYVTALGLFELHLNGERIGRDIFSPEWTDYNSRIQYRTYEVTEHLKQGKNAVGAVVGDGWYSGFLGWRKLRGLYGLQNCLFLQMEVEYDDGTRALVVSDNTWKWNEGPIRSSDLLMGEVYDSRKEIEGWDTADFDDGSWNKTAVIAAPSGQMVAQPSQPLRITQHLHSQSVTEPQKGVFVFDLGQNIAGWARLKVRGQAGDTVILRFAERLRPNGMIYTENLRGAKCTDTYILKGGEEETYEPHFTFHGFQFVEVSGYPGTPDPEAITGCVLHSDAPFVGKFTCSDPMVNQLYSNLVRSQRGNYLSIPTDCPQRDERLGWMGDAQIFFRTGSFNQDVAAFFTKWMRDVVDAQSSQGAFPDFAPRLEEKEFSRFEAAPAWGDAGVIIPWTMYRVYGDTRIIEEHWEAMQSWMDYLVKTNPDLIRRKGVNNNYGDWLSIEADTPKDLLATAYWAHDAWLMSEMAEVSGRKTEQTEYLAFFHKIRQVFQNKFINPDGRIKGETQTGYLLALAMDLYPEELQVQAVEHLVADIQKRGKHLSTGFVGCGFLNPVLSRRGHNEIAYQLLLNKTFPSWGYSIQQGATSIWERWDGWTEDKGFQDPGMNSFNHYAFGAIGEWLYRYVAGIDLDDTQPAYKKMKIRPYPGAGLNSARAEYNSMHGTIHSGWEKVGSRLTMEVSLPANTTALVYVPTSDTNSIVENNKPVSRAEGVRFLRRENNCSVFEVESGTYYFSFPWQDK